MPFYISRSCAKDQQRQSDFAVTDVLGWGKGQKEPGYIFHCLRAENAARDASGAQADGFD
jgi:hypothetical protein